MRHHLLIIMMLALQVAVASAENAVNEKAAEFTLQNQHEKTVSLRQYEGRSVVLIASDREGKEQNGAWTRAIKDKYANLVVVLGIADVSSAPFFMKGFIRNTLRKEPDIILLDWKGEVFKAYSLTKGVSNIILIDKDGMIRHRASGPAAPEAVQELFKKIDLLFPQ